MNFGELKILVLKMWSIHYLTLSGGPGQAALAGGRLGVGAVVVGPRQRRRARPDRPAPHLRRQPGRLEPRLEALHHRRARLQSRYSADLTPKKELNL